MQQTKSSTDKGLAIARLLTAFSMFPMVLDPVKFSWVLILPSLVMIYFSAKKYKEETNMGIEGSKYGLIAIMSSVVTIVSIAITLVYWLGYY